MLQIQMGKKQLVEWLDLDPRLRAIFWAATALWTDKTLRITSIHRTREHDRKIKNKRVEDYVPGVHTVGPPYRAMDLLIKGLKPEDVSRIEEVINGRWEYDPDRPNKVVCYVKPHGTGPHMHLQIHPNTRRRR